METYLAKDSIKLVYVIPYYEKLNKMLYATSSIYMDWPDQQHWTNLFCSCRGIGNQSGWNTDLQRNKVDLKYNN